MLFCYLRLLGWFIWTWEWEWKREFEIGKMHKDAVAWDILEFWETFGIRTDTTCLFGLIVFVMNHTTLLLSTFKVLCSECMTERTTPNGDAMPSASAKCSSRAEKAMPAFYSARRPTYYTFTARRRGAQHHQRHTAASMQRCNLFLSPRHPTGPSKSQQLIHAITYISVEMREQRASSDCRLDMRMLRSVVAEQPLWLC